MDGQGYLLLAVLAVMAYFAYTKWGPCPSGQFRAAGKCHPLLQANIVSPTLGGW